MKFSLATLGLLLCMAVPANAGLVHSWEGGGLDGWFALETTAVLTPEAGPGVTDGSQAIKVEHTKASGQVSFMRINNTDSTWFTALKNADNTKMLVDVFVPASAINTGSWSQVGMQLQGGGFATVDTLAPFSKVGGVFLDQTVTLEIDLTGIAADLASATWGQATIFIHGAASNLRSPVYVDNYRIVTAAIPEPSSVAMLAVGSLVYGVVRRRRK